MSARQFKLIQLPRVSSDTVKCLEVLLDRARRGEIVGISYAAVQSDREFFYNACGEAHRNPVMAAALASTLLYGTMKKVFNDK